MLCLIAYMLCGNNAKLTESWGCSIALLTLSAAVPGSVQLTCCAQVLCVVMSKTCFRHKRSCRSTVPHSVYAMRQQRERQQGDSHRLRPAAWPENHVLDSFCAATLSADVTLFPQIALDSLSTKRYLQRKLKPNIT